MWPSFNISELSAHYSSVGVVVSSTDNLLTYSKMSSFKLLVGITGIPLSEYMTMSLARVSGWDVQLESVFRIPVQAQRFSFFNGFKPIHQIRNQAIW